LFGGISPSFRRYAASLRNFQTGAEYFRADRANFRATT
jgi:hypothetical protein